MNTMKPQQFDLLLSDDSQLRVTPNVRDSLAYESAARGKTWGAPQDNSIRMLSIRAWSAARREHPEKIGSTGWQQFVEATDPAALHLIDFAPAKDEDPVDLDEVGELGESTGADQSTD